MRLQQKSLDQTGVAILKLGDKEKAIPLFSLSPAEEASNLIEECFPEYSEANVTIFVTNNLLETKIEDMISEFRENYLALPEDYMEDLVSGFPFVYNRDSDSEITKHFYL